MAQLAGNLSGYPAVDRFVTDRTQLTGRYDFELEEQLGVTLEAEMLVVPVLVIDTLERPSPD